VDALVIGYSAYDQTVLELFHEAADDIRSLYVVNADQGSGVEVAMRMCRHFGFTVNDPRVGVADEAFQLWVRSGIAGYPEWVAGRG
jgi:hypothetical protein